jgi:hypothetical protein
VRRRGDLQRLKLFRRNLYIRTRNPVGQLRKRRLRLGSARALPLYRTTTTNRVHQTEVCTGTARTKEQSQRRVRSLLPRMVSKEQPTDLEGQTRAQLIMARRTSLHPKAEYICADLSSRPTLFPCSRAAEPYIPVTLPCGLASAGGFAIKKGARDLDGTCDSGGWRLDR